MMLSPSELGYLRDVCRRTQEPWVFDTTRLVSGIGDASLATVAKKWMPRLLAEVVRAYSRAVKAEREAQRLQNHLGLGWHLHP